MEMMNWSWLSEDHILINLGSPTDLRALNIAIHLEKVINTDHPHWLLDHGYGFGKLSLTIRPRLIQVDQILDWICMHAQNHGSSEQLDVSTIVIRACYDPRVAPDLIAVSERLGLTPNELIHIHSERTYRVLATGFMPGFGYLGETDTRLHLLRKDIPMTRIPCGSLAIAENQTAIYPKEIPGGWHLIGCVAQSLVTVTETSIKPLLSIGRSVRFEPISYDIFCRKSGR